MEAPVSEAPEIWGSGIAYPVSADGAGRLRMSSGLDRLWESIQSILETPQGTCPMDPGFGLEMVTYAGPRQIAQIGWAIGRAIERSEPRADRIEVDLLGVDVDDGSISVRITVQPIGSQVKTNRVFPVYGLLG